MYVSGPGVGALSITAAVPRSTSQAGTTGDGWRTPQNIEKKEIEREKKTWTPWFRDAYARETCIPIGEPPLASPSV